jgi:adenine deaminase
VEQLFFIENKYDMKIAGNIIDIQNREIYPGVITIAGDRIVSLERDANPYDRYILPGFIDSHVHVESSMLLPMEFARAVVGHGTVAVVNDPHEIANVLGTEGVEAMMENSKEAVIKFFYGIPSCVPATPFDRAGSAISAEETEILARSGRFVALSEMMNVPGVVHRDPEVMAKLEIARRYHLRIDGHAPGVVDEEILSHYIGSGIETDHESVTLEEAELKISKGMKILIREGSAAKNCQALKELIATHPDNVMFCTDDSHPDDLLQSGHIDRMVRQALKDGFGLFDVLQVACINPVLFYRLEVGLLREGDLADFIVVDDLETMQVISTYLRGEEVFPLPPRAILPREKIYPNLFHHDCITEEDIQTVLTGDIHCIQVQPNELVTGKRTYSPQKTGDKFESDIPADILKIVYVNRYFNLRPQVGFISGIGIKEGAFASCISHDSHNIVAIGCSDSELIRAINQIIDQRGGLAVVHGDKLLSFPLPIAGIVSEKSVEEVSRCYRELGEEIARMGSPLTSPFMTLSFMALIVIPAYKIGERGMFDVEKFDFEEK